MKQQQLHDFLARVPQRRKLLVSVREIKVGECFFVHGCPRCKKEFFYEGTALPDCISIFNMKGHTVVCPECG